MKQFLLATAFLICSFVGFGQCDIPILTNQTQIDNFPTDFPGCTSVFSLRIIGNASITDLSPLSQITFVEQNMTINNCPSLQNLSGLDNITYVGRGLSIFLNNSLTSLTGLEGLSTINGTFSIGQNQNLPNLQGLNSLVEIAEDINGEGNFLISLNNSLVNLSGLENLSDVALEFTVSDNIELENINALSNIIAFNSRVQISGNTNLQTLEGLSNLESISGSLQLVLNNSLTTLNGLESLELVNGNIAIVANTLLTSISALENIESSSIGSNITITNNPLLSECDILPFCEIISNPSITFNVENNNNGCNSRAEIEIECDILDIPDINFLNALRNYTPPIDTNSDGNIQFDEAEAFTGTLDVANKVIADFTGLEAFVNSTGFNGSGNFMGALSLEANTELTSVDFSDSPDLERVNLRNGNNTTITIFNGVDCPSLQFICVDNVAFAEANFINIDPQVIFVEDCEILAVPEFNLGENISVFPNPVLDILTFSTTSNFNFIKAEVYSVTGQKLTETSVTQVNLSDLSAGIYFVTVVTDKGRVTKKIVKH